MKEKADPQALSHREMKQNGSLAWDSPLSSLEVADLQWGWLLKSSLMRPEQVVQEEEAVRRQLKHRGELWVEKGVKGPCSKDLRNKMSE